MSQSMTITQPQLLTPGMSQGPIRADKVCPALAGIVGAEAHAHCPSTEPEEIKELPQPSSHHTGSEDRAKEAEPSGEALFEVLIKPFLKPYSDFSVIYASDFQPVCHKGHTGMP